VQNVRVHLDVMPFLHGSTHQTAFDIRRRIALTATPHSFKNRSASRSTLSRHTFTVSCGTTLARVSISRLRMYSQFHCRAARHSLPILFLHLLLYRYHYLMLLSPPGIYFPFSLDLNCSSCRFIPKADYKVFWCETALTSKRPKSVLYYPPIVLVFPSISATIYRTLFAIFCL